MMLRVRIKLLTPLLGSKATRDGVRRFNRDNRMDGDTVPLDMALWHWALSQAADTLGVPFSGDMVRMADGVKGPALSLYIRRYRRSAGGEECKEQFESVRGGAELDIPFMLFTSPAPGAGKDGILTLEDFRRILELTGSMVGVSPWGSKFGYGRFRLLGVEESAS
jgi:hypothetical protein